MSDIFNGLSEEEIAAYSAVPSEEPHIVVGPNRVVTVPESLKRIGVQYDHNIETVTFDCPRYWDGHDMSTMVVYINYLTSNGDTGSFVAKNVTVDENDISIMHFDWTISKHVTSANGNIAFLVCIKNTNEDGLEINHWNSELNRDLYISEGLELRGEDIQEDYPDVITQILLRLNDVEEAIGDAPGDLPTDKTSAFKIIGFTEGCDYIATADDGYTAFVTAVNEAIDGDTILVMQGTYNGDSEFILEKNVNFVGIGKPEIDFPVKIQGGGIFDYEMWDWAELYPNITSKWNGFKFLKTFIVGCMNKADEELRYGRAFMTDCDFTASAFVNGEFTRCSFTGDYIEIGHYYGASSILTECNIVISSNFYSDSGSDKYRMCNIYCKANATPHITTYEDGNLEGCKIFAPNDTIYLTDSHGGGDIYLGDTLIFANGVTYDYTIVGGCLIKGTSL